MKTLLVPLWGNPHTIRNGSAMRKPFPLHDVIMRSVIHTYKYIDGLVQEKRNFIATALELRLSCTNPSTYSFTRLLNYARGISLDLCVGIVVMDSISRINLYLISLVSKYRILPYQWHVSILQPETQSNIKRKNYLHVSWSFLKLC